MGRRVRPWSACPVHDCCPAASPVALSLCVDRSVGCWIWHSSAPSPPDQGRGVQRLATPIWTVGSRRGRDDRAKRYFVVRDGPAVATTGVRAWFVPRTIALPPNANPFASGPPRPTPTSAPTTPPRKVPTAGIGITAVPAWAPATNPVTPPAARPTCSEVSIRSDMWRPSIDLCSVSCSVAPTAPA
jgi:cell division septation protein DedD